MNKFPPAVVWLASILPALAPTGNAETVILDSVVAIVEDDIVMASELQDRITAVTANLEARGQELPPREVLVRETLDRLILESIQLQRGRRAGVRISDAQLNGALGRVAAQRDMSLDEFRQRLEREGGSYQRMREDVRRELIVQRVQAGNVSQRIQITDQEIENFLESEEGRAMVEEEYRLIHALLPVEETPGEERRIGDYVDELHDRIVAGEQFEQVIAGGTGEYAFVGGDLGWRRRADLPSLFADVAPALEVGETSAPIRSPSGYHLVYLAEKRGGSLVVEQSHVRHILLKPSAIRTDEDTGALAGDLRRQVLDGADFEELAREYSEDIGTAQEGGDLGWAGPGQMVPEFEDVMNSTAVGGVSQPFRSQFGWHILQVLERRRQDISDTVARNRAGEVLHHRKYQEELDAWLRKIRDEAFVDIK